jgi:hypothetical protein
MANVIAVRSLFGCLLLVALGCSTADGLGTSGGGGTGDHGPAEPEPAPDGDACGPEVFGWETECSVVGQITYENPLAPGDYLELDPFTGATVACCEGTPSVGTADSACVDACIVALCELAEDIYDAIAHENGWHCTTGCRFDLEGCVAGIPAQQFPHPPFGDDYPHEVTVSCEATNVEPRRPDGTFDFIETPTHWSYDDPPVCDPPSMAAGLEPLRSLVANTAVDDAGTQAVATWWTATSEGRQSSSSVTVAVDYALHPCGEGECVELTRFDASVPAGVYAGIEVQAADLTLVAVTARPLLDRSGYFQFPPGSLHFLLRASVGGLPVAISRTNATTTHGRISHAADLFELMALHFRYEDSDFGADLGLDLVGSHANRAPLAIIRRIDSPPDCDEPLVLEAASVDPDGGPMQHYWWTPNGMTRASAVELVLSPGRHRVVLLTIDGRGAHGVSGLTFTRHCA